MSAPRPKDEILWEAVQRPTGRAARFARRPDVQETFEYTLLDWDGITYRWDVSALQARLDGRPVTLEPLAPISVLIDSGLAEVDHARVQTDPSIDPDLPAIALPLPFPIAPGGQELCIVVDGWHRIARAHVLGWTEIPLVVGTRADEAAVRLAPDARTLAEILLPQLNQRAVEAEARGGQPRPVLHLDPDGHVSMTPPASGGICDFCSGRPVRWCYPAYSFQLDSYGWQSVGNWGACDPCSRLMEAGDLAGLTERAVAALFARNQIRPSREQRDGAQAMIAAMHAALVVNRCGVRHPTHPVPPTGLIGPHDD
jgi:hypothetical protein